MMVFDIDKIILSTFFTLYSSFSYYSSFQKLSQTTHNYTIVNSNSTLLASNFRHDVISKVNGDDSDYVISSYILVFKWYMSILPLKLLHE
jgi:hypothetical protein